jgi:hypothetical protein
MNEEQINKAMEEIGLHFSNSKDVKAALFQAYLIAENGCFLG